MTQLDSPGKSHENTAHLDESNKLGIVVHLEVPSHSGYGPRQGNCWLLWKRGCLATTGKLVNIYGFLWFFSTYELLEVI